MDRLEEGLTVDQFRFRSVEEQSKVQCGFLIRLWAGKELYGMSRDKVAEDRETDENSGVTYQESREGDVVDNQVEGNSTVTGNKG